MSYLDKLKQKLNDKKAQIGIVGLGYVGLPIVSAYCEKGFKVVGFDVDQSKVDSLKKGRSYIKHFPDAVIQDCLKNGLEPTTDFSKIADVDAIVICVPTPLNKNNGPDLQYIEKTMDQVVSFLKPGQVLSLESTTYPGTTNEVIVTFLKNETDLLVGDNFFVVYSPEREDPGRTDHSLKTIPKVCGGVTESCLQAGSSLYAQVVDKVVEVSSPEVAEMTKILENIHRAVNIGLINEMKIIADKMNINIFEVIDAAATKPFGFVPYYPGPGLGGHCIPIDPFYLTWKAKEYGVNTRFIELAGEINSQMPQYVVAKAVDGLNQQRLPMKDSKILILGVAYKKNLDDHRESPALKIIKLLNELGANVQYHDPHIPEIKASRNFSGIIQSQPLTQELLQSAQQVIIVTNHDSIDYDMVLEVSQQIVDTRGVYSNLESPKVIRS